MQPAREDVVQNLTRPASAASASARRGARMSFPSCEPCPRASPKSSVQVASPRIGKTSRGTFPAGAASAADADEAERKRAHAKGGDGEEESSSG